MNDKTIIEAQNPLLQQALVSGSAVFNMDCIEFMKQVPDKFFHLAIVDPPYGIGAGSVNFKSGTRVRPSKFHKQNDWDTSIPAPEYWEQLFRVSKNQIVWGANYMIEHLEPTPCFIVWDKVQPEAFSMAMCEIAWTSFKSPAKIFKKRIVGADDIRIHPTQKPVYLYEWLLKNFAEQGNLILDTHLGSGGSRIAAHKAGKIFVGTEIDKDYFEMQETRWKNFTAQLTMF